MKNINIYTSLFMIISIAIISCSIEPKPINYGVDACDNCRMTIVDKVHAAELVSKKGKVLKYDAIECMIRHFNKGDIDVNDYELFLINELETPEKLIDATKSYYLISPNMPSPMGGNLTGFAEKENAEKYKKIRGGKIYNWTEIKKQF